MFVALRQRYIRCGEATVSESVTSRIEEDIVLLA